LKIKTVDFQAGDMDMAVELDDGMEKLEASWSIYGFDELQYALFGMGKGGSRPVSVRSTYTDRKGNTHTVVETLRGFVKELTRDGQDTGSQREKSLKAVMAVDYYKITYDGVNLIEIDAENGLRSLSGIDMLEGVRAAISLI
jgi:P2 family phage contractile tail tube protein